MDLSHIFEIFCLTQRVTSGFDVDWARSTGLTRSITPRILVGRILRGRLKCVLNPLAVFAWLSQNLLILTCLIVSSRSMPTPHGRMPLDSCWSIFLRGRIRYIPKPACTYRACGAIPNFTYFYMLNRARPCLNVLVKKVLPESDP